jgi:hypothetical protein
MFIRCNYKGPILGITPWNNLYLMGGYWRNGVLLAPKTGFLLAHLMANKANDLSADDQQLLAAFGWDRFTSSNERGKKITAANARYAASMHPIHSRKSGAGVAASVGTELGSYSTARSAKEERARDRQSFLFSSSSSDSVNKQMDAMFEQAAALGKSDAMAYTGLENQKTKEKDDQDNSNNEEANTSKTVAFEGSADAYTVGFSSSSSTGQDDTVNGSTLTASSSSSSGTMVLDDVYESIRVNKAQQSVGMDDDNVNSSDDERPDPGFRISHVDEMTGEQWEVPPYTKPGEFLSTIKQRQQQQGERPT